MLRLIDETCQEQENNRRQRVLIWEQARHSEAYYFGLRDGRESITLNENGNLVHSRCDSLNEDTNMMVV